YAIHGENRFHAVFDTGLLCCCIHPSATGTALSAYDATLEVVSPKGTRSMPIDKFFFRPTDDATRENNLGPGDVIASVTLPAPAAGTRAVYRKLKEKESFDWPLVETCVVFSLDGDVIRDPRVFFGSVAPTPYRSKEAEAALAGKRPSAEVAKKAAEAAVATAKPPSPTAHQRRPGRREL